MDISSIVTEPQPLPAMPSPPAICASCLGCSSIKRSTEHKKAKEEKKDLSKKEKEEKSALKREAIEKRKADKLAAPKKERKRSVSDTESDASSERPAKKQKPAKEPEPELVYDKSPVKIVPENPSYLYERDKLRIVGTCPNCHKSVSSFVKVDLVSDEILSQFGLSHELIAKRKEEKKAAKKAASDKKE